MLILTIVAMLAANGANGATWKELSANQVRVLAAEILRHTPEHVHFSEGAAFSWVLVEIPKADPTPAVTKAVLDLLSQKYTVYLRKDVTVR
jgi:hypothetical protein